MFRVNPLKSNIQYAIRYKTTTATVITHLANDDYQFMPKSKIPMLHFQPSLPRLPIPLLENTCNRYLAALKPILSDNVYSTTEKIVHTFRTDSGFQLQAFLKDTDLKNKHTSYISTPWFDMYLKSRSPLPVNFNAGLIMNKDVRTEYNNQLIRTTNLVVSSLRFMRSLRAHTLAPEVYHLNPKKSNTNTYRTVTSLTPAIVSTYVSYAFKAFPLDMSQYQGLFGATRIPEIEQDRIYKNTDSRHMLVLRRGHFYAVDVLEKNGDIVPPEMIMARLKYILTNEQPAQEFSIGSMTTANRDTWAKVRKHLIDIGNADALETVDSALYCLCLDEDEYDTVNPTRMVRGKLCGNIHNRWFDKSISLIVSKDGASAINLEHSWGDGVAVLRFFNDIYNESIQTPFVHPKTQPRETSDIAHVVRPIDITLDDQSKEAIVEAQKTHNAINKSLNIDFLLYHGINKKMCKNYGLSPDSIMQLSFQLAFFKQYGKYVATYESCSTAAFRHGRTETMRPCTMATKAFCDAVVARNKPDVNELRNLIDNCSKAHGTLTKDAAMGQGFDRHLFGLKHMADMNGCSLPALYQDPAYALINHNIISTSTLSAPTLFAGAFGPVVNDGYGIAYNIQNDYLGAIITSYAGERNGSEFIDCLRQSYDDIKNIVESTSRKP